MAMEKAEVCPCPICQKILPIHEINAHLDQCLVGRPNPTPSPKRARKALCEEAPVVLRLSAATQAAEALPIALPNSPADASGEVTRAVAVTTPSDVVAELLRELRSFHAKVEWAKSPQANSLLAKQVKEWKDLLSGSPPDEDNASASFGAGEWDYLRSTEKRTLAELDEALTSATAQVEHWRSVIEGHAEASADSLATYEASASPSNYSEQCERNRLRSELRRAVAGTMEALEEIHEATGEPGKLLSRSERSTLNEMGGAIDRLGRLRDDARCHFQEQHSRVRSRHDNTSAALAKLQPHIDRMDGFVQRIDRETADEAVRAREVHQQRLEELQAEEARHVKANDCPLKNPVFAKVREDIDSMMALLKDTESQESEQQAFRERWQALMDKMPCAEELEEPGPAAEPEPGTRKRKWSSWIWGS